MPLPRHTSPSSFFQCLNEFAEVALIRTVKEHDCFECLVLCTLFSICAIADFLLARGIWMLTSCKKGRKWQDSIENKVNVMLDVL